MFHLASCYLVHIIWQRGEAREAEEAAKANRKKKRGKGKGRGKGRGPKKK